MENKMKKKKKKYNGLRPTEFRDPRASAINKLNAAQLIEYSLDGSDYERGKLETVEAAVDKTAAALGRLVQILFEKKVINYTEVYAIADVSPSLAIDEEW